MTKFQKEIKTALISVYHKDNLDGILTVLDRLNVKMISTGGTAGYIEGKGFSVQKVEELTGYPDILGGRVKTLHPVIFGGILGRGHLEQDLADRSLYHLPAIDLVIVDLYPFEETLQKGGTQEEIIEKIDIGGISLIRAAAKNYQDVLIIPSKDAYPDLLRILSDDGGVTSIEQRQFFARKAFAVSSHYDTAIWKYFSGDEPDEFKLSVPQGRSLRYGENPHQKGRFFGDFQALFDQLHGKEISYNNLLDVDAAVRLMDEFDDTSVAVLKHNNACGFATRTKLTEAWKDALAGDPVSAFGGILVANREIDEQTATEMHKIFFEVIIAPGYSEQALDILKGKKNRMILQRKTDQLPDEQFRSLLNGVLWQERDDRTEQLSELQPVTAERPDTSLEEDLLFANKLVKHTKSNAIVLVRNKQLIGSGTGQTSRIDALKQAIAKAQEFSHDLRGAVMASDAFFPFKDSVEIAHQAGIKAVIQPGGSIRDQESIDYCNQVGIRMVFTGVRHFKH